MSGNNIQSKNWCFTLNNPDISEADCLSLFTSHSSFKYVVFQLESGENGTPHFQGYAEFVSNQRLSALRLILPTAHWEKRKSRTNVAAIEYCTKLDSRVAGHEPIIAGEPTPNQPGKRPQISVFLENVGTSGLVSAAMSNPDVYVRYSSGIQKFLALRVVQRSADEPPPVITLMYGPPGCGKTSYYYETEGSEAFSLPCSNGFWFDGYCGQPSCILDDFDGRSSHWTLSQTLRVFDRYRFQVPIKGSHVVWGPDRLYCSSNIHPSLWYDYSSRDAQYDALVRRITHVRWWWYKRGVPRDMSNPSFDFVLVTNPRSLAQDGTVVNLSDPTDPVSVNNALWRKFFYEHPRFLDADNKPIPNVDPYDF